MSILKKTNKVLQSKGEVLGGCGANQPHDGWNERTETILSQHYTNYLEILNNIKHRPRMPLPGEIEESRNTRKQKRIRWVDRPLTRSSSSDHIYGVPCRKSNLHRNHLQKSESSLCNLGVNHVDSLQLQHSRESCSKTLKCKGHRTHKLKRSASTNTIAGNEKKCPETRNLYRNVSCRQVNELTHHQHQQYQLLCPKLNRIPQHNLWQIEERERGRKDSNIAPPNHQTTNNIINSHPLSNQQLANQKQVNDKPVRQMTKSNNTVQTTSKRIRLFFGVKWGEKGIHGNTLIRTKIYFFNLFSEYK